MRIATSLPHLDAEQVRLLYSVLRVRAGGVEEGHDAQEPPSAILIVLARNGERADPARAELVHLPFHRQVRIQILTGAADSISALDPRRVVHFDFFCSW